MNAKISTILFTTLVLVLAACKQPTPDNPQSGSSPITLDNVTLTMKVGDYATLDAGSARNVVWTSSDETVATVYAGVVTAEAIGQAVITAQSGNEKATCVIFVTGANGASLRIAPLVVNMEAGETFQMQVYNTYDMELVWTTSNSEAVIVDQNGLVAAVAPGVATITVASELEKMEAIVTVAHHWGEYKLVWSDEFDGTELDRNTWNIEKGGGGWGNNELQYYTDRPENLRVENGNLVIEARKETYQNREYTSARMQSRGKKEFLYGKVEARIKFPGGGGTWPAFWMMGNRGGWPACGEIDIIEHVGNMDKRASAALHTPMANGSKGNNWSKTRWFDYNLSDDFHVYGVEWAQEENNGFDVIRFYVDNEVYAEAWETTRNNNDYWPFDKPHYIIFNCAIGGNMGGRVDDNIFNQERKMFVDWVRVYQREEAK